MTTMINTTNALDLNELENFIGGESLDAFDVYADYLNTLYAKYNCAELEQMRRGRLRYLKTLCTPEEKARISELWHAFQNAEGVANN